MRVASLALLFRWQYVQRSLQVQPQHTTSAGFNIKGATQGAVPLGGFQSVLPSPNAAQQATYEGLLTVAAEVFERRSVWSKTQSSLQHLQVSQRLNAKTATTSPVQDVEVGSHGS